MTLELGGIARRVDVRGAYGGLALTASGRGAAALIADVGPLRRVAVYEPLAREPGPALHARLALALREGTPEQVVAQCRQEGASVVVAELRSPGEVHVVGWAAPSVLHVSTDRPGLTPLPVPTREAVAIRMMPGELLVLCSPGVLVEPPACLHADAVALCPPGGPGAWDWAWQGLVEPLREGAVAILRAA